MNLRFCASDICELSVLVLRAMFFVGVLLLYGFVDLDGAGGRELLVLVLRAISFMDVLALYGLAGLAVLVSPFILVP